MMVYPYRGEDMECAAVARATMLANSGNTHHHVAEDSMGIYSTSESEIDNFSHTSNSVSTSLLVGTFYNPNNPSATNSVISSLQDEPREDQPVKQSSFTWKDPTPEQALGLAQQGRRRFWFWSCVIALCLLIGVAVSMGIIIGVNHEKNKVSSIRGPPPTTFASDESEDGNASSFADNTTSSTTPSPTPQQSANSALAATLPPTPTIPRPVNSTTETINTFVRNLPPYTQQALDVPTSSQQRALNWLTKDAALLSYTPTQLLQRYVLKTFYFATNGDNDELDSDEQWLQADGWSSSSLSLANQHECQWFSTFEDNTIEPPCNEQGIYTILSVRRNNLRGSLPRELALLTSLKVLDLELNSIQSDIPSEFGLLTNLEHLLLGGNDLTGTIPTHLAQLSLLVELELENNDLSGAIPGELAALNKLVNLTLDDNQLQGGIPTELGDLTLLENLLLHGNMLTGAIPTEVGMWTKMLSLSLRNNLLSDSVPTEMGLLTNLERLWAYQNELGGSLPTELGQATKLTQLSFSRNQMTGQLPTELGHLIGLKNLWLYQNQFTGSLPTELGRLTNLELLPVRDNEIRGAVPAEVCAIPLLEVTVDCLEVSCDCECTCANAEEVTDDAIRG